MRCPACGQEVLLAATCPYCGADVPKVRREAPSTSARGRFRGRLAEHEESKGNPFRGPWVASREMGRFIRGRRAAGLRLLAQITWLVRYLRDPSTPRWKKLVTGLAALYVLWPADLIPDLPIVGWIDDVAVVALGLRWMLGELERYREKLRRGGR